MKNNLIYYSVGALLYCPANSDSVANSIINGKFSSNFSLALCLEDTIPDNCVLEAEQKLIQSISNIYEKYISDGIHIPKIFIRVRNYTQIYELCDSLKDCMDIVTGFIIPKFSLENADRYIEAIFNVNQKSNKKIYMMPIYESVAIVNLQMRYDILYELKYKLARIEELVLNIRVGGNDLCHIFGFRRHDDESIHDIKPISSIFSDIVTVYGTDYVISAPVWEYYDSSNWEKGLLDEIKGDILCGFVGKTVIHPKQIEVINEGFKVHKKDFEDAKAILNWNKNSKLLVSGSTKSERMNEYNTHHIWAEKIMLMAEAFGVKELVD